MVRNIARPAVVHLLKDTDKVMVNTKCGMKRKIGEIKTTAWSTEVTCDVCSP